MSMNLVTLLYLVASVCFIQALKGLSHPTTSIRGNLFGMVGMALAVLTTLTQTPNAALIIGGIVALWLTGYTLSFTAVIGFIALVGIEIKNSILLVDFTVQLQRQGVPLREAIEKAGEIRFLPVLLTSATAIGGLLPLAVEGSGLYSPLACVIIGGLVTSTLLSRIVTPVMYLLLAPRGRKPRMAPVSPAPQVA